MSAMGPEADIPFPDQLVSLPSADGAGPLDACHWWRRPRAVKDGLVGVLYVLKIVDCTKGNNRRINLGIILRYRNSAPMIAPRSANTAPVAKSKKSGRGYKKLIKRAGTSSLDRYAGRHHFWERQCTQDPNARR
jgi:hypothetical protein